MNDLREQLRHCLKGRVCLIALGNIDYGDDGFGVRLGEKLLKAGLPDVIIAGAEPDRYIGRVADEGFDRLVFLDAVEFGGSPGSVVFLDAKEISARYPQISTHKISLGVLARWVEASGRTKVWLLGAQPESMRAGQQLTPTAQATLEVLRELLVSLAPGRNDVGAGALTRPAERSSAVPTREDAAVTV
jgi:hydrogenase maturation protease